MESCVISPKRWRRSRVKELKPQMDTDEQRWDRGCVASTSRGPLLPCNNPLPIGK